ncbi:MAG: hypothetical protein DI539_20415 [Flavobacterium psychrophilum]|nr:MAG: hypothetical protein DI539_20415 [Flavobacterium psychrophilum]
MQIIFNGKELQLNPDSKVALTLQINNVADISKPNTSFTNSFKVPKGAKNDLIMEFLGVNGSNTRIPYSQNKVTMLEDSIVLVNDGYAVVDSTSDPRNYALNIYGSEKTFFQVIKNYTLQDVYPDTNVMWTAPNLLNYVTSMTDWCLPVAQYNADAYHTSFAQAGITGAYTRTKALETSPHFFVKKLFESIFSYLGYTVSYPMSGDNVFNRLVIPSQKGVKELSVVYGANFNIKQCVFNKGCDILIKELMQRYGLLIKVDELKKKVTFTRFTDLLTTSPILDWTDKYIEMKNEKYSIGSYAQTNYYKYSEDILDDGVANISIIIPSFGANALQGSFNIDNATLDKENTVFESTFSKAKAWGEKIITGTTEAFGIASQGRLFTPSTGLLGYPLFNVAENELSDFDNPASEKKNRENEFQLMYLKTIEDPVNFGIMDNFGVYQQLVTSQAKVCTHDNIGFQKFLDDNYSGVISLLDNMVVTKVMMNLSVLDIYQFDFHKRIYLQQYASYFYVNRISNWQKNKLTEVELIKIPAII